MSQSKNKLQLLVLLAILVLFPLLSWYYLKTGFDYQMDARAELKDYGKLARFSLIDKNGIAFNNDSLGNDMAVISVLGQDEEINKKVIEVLVNLNGQFDNNSKLKLILTSLDSDNISQEDLNKIFEENSFSENQHVLLSGEKSVLQSWIGKGIKIPKGVVEKENEVPEIYLEADNSGSIKDYPYFVLVDTTQTIRNYYHIKEKKDVGRMVEHIALMIPKDPEKDAILVREKEK